MVIAAKEYASDDATAVEHDVIMFSIERAAILAARRFEN